MAAIGADGEIAPEELSTLSAVVNRMGMFANLNDNQFNSSLRKVLKILERKGPSELMAMSATQVPEDYRVTCFALCMDIVLSDGILDPEEEALMVGLQKALNVDHNLAHKILEVMLIKNKP